MVILILGLFAVNLAACQSETGNLKGLVINNSSVEFGSIQDPDDRKLHFWAEISDYGTESELEYKIRFIVLNPYIHDLIGAEIIEVPDTYKSQSFPNNGSRGLITSGSAEIKQDFNIDKIRKNLKNDKAVIVEIYDSNGTIARDIVTNFKENIMPKAKINPKAKIEVIDLKDKDKITIFKNAIKDATKNLNRYYLVNPDYSFTLDEDTYYLWLSEDEGSIMNAKDIYATFLLSKNSLNEIDKILQK